MTLRAAAVVPPIVFELAPSKWTPSWLLATTVTPSAASPMWLPRTRLKPVFAWSRAMPALRLPETTLRAPAVRPPISLLLAPACSWMPSSVLPSAAWPLASVPMKLPATTLFQALAPSRMRPFRPLPESTLRSAVVTPPMMFRAPPT